MPASGLLASRSLGAEIRSLMRDLIALQSYVLESKKKLAQSSGSKGHQGT